MRGEYQKHRGQRDVFVICDHKLHVDILVGAFSLGREHIVEIVYAVEMQPIAQSRLCVQAVPDLQPLHSGGHDVHALAESQTDVVASLWLHPVQYGRFVLCQVKHDRVGRQDIGVGFPEDPVAGAIIQLDLLELFLRQSDPVAVRVEILFPAPV